MEYNIKPTKPPRQEGGFPQTIPQLIQKYKLDSLWDNISSMVKEIIEQNSGYVVKRDGVMYIADNNNLEKAVVVLRIGQNFLDISNNGINGDYTTIISKNGIINADFIKAGTISADRIKGGTLIVGGKDNGNGTIKVNDANGNTNILMNNQGIQLSDGATLVGGKGLLTNLQFIGRIVSSNDNAKNTSNGDFSMLGFECGGFLEGVARTYMSITPEIPKNFTIQKAFVSLYHYPIRGYAYTYNPSNGTEYNIDEYGYCRNLKLYKKEIAGNACQEVLIDAYRNDFFGDATGITEIKNAFGSNGFNPAVANANTHKFEKIESIDITAELNTFTDKSKMQLIVQSSANKPNYSAYEGPNISADTYKNCIRMSGMVKAVLNIFGYLKT